LGAALYTKVPELSQCVRALSVLSNFCIALTPRPKERKKERKKNLKK
jgi:hypothetical protein